MKDHLKIRAFRKGCYFGSQAVCLPSGLFTNTKTLSRCFHLSIGKHPEDAGAALGALESRGHARKPLQLPQGGEAGVSHSKQ